MLTGYATPALVVHEFTHLVLIRATKDLNAQWQYSAIEAGVDNYLTADFLSSPTIDDVNLTQAFSFSIDHTWDGGQGDGGRAWGAFLWSLRGQSVDTKALTKEIVTAWTAIEPTTPPHDYQTDFLKKLANGGVDAQLIKRTFEAAPK